MYSEVVAAGLRKPVFTNINVIPGLTMSGGQIHSLDLVYDFYAEFRFDAEQLSLLIKFFQEPQVMELLEAEQGEKHLEALRLLFGITRLAQALITMSDKLKPNKGGNDGIKDRGDQLGKVQEVQDESESLPFL